MESIINGDQNLKSLSQMYSDEDLTVKPNECAIIFDEKGRIRPIIQLPENDPNEKLPENLEEAFEKIRGVVLVQAITKALVEGDKHLEELFDKQLKELFDSLEKFKTQFEQMTNIKINQPEEKESK